MWIILAVVAVLAVWAIALYNKLVALRQRFKNAYAQIDVQVTRRYDLIPNLVETAKTYMKHERETLEAVIAARNSAVTANTLAAAHPDDARAIEEAGRAESTLTGALSRFVALAENYPDLKADGSLSQLMEELTSTENKVAFARQAYNDGVTHYNTACAQFPGNLIARQFGFQEAALFVVESDAVRKPVRVQFS